MENRKIERVEQMPVYEEFFESAVSLEKVTRSFPSDFRWLRSQVCRSAESVCANLTEGFYSQYSTEYLQGLYRCRREARETLTHLQYGAAVGLLTKEQTAGLAARYEEALHQLANLTASIERKIRERGKAKPGSSIVREDAGDYKADGIPGDD